LTNIIFDQVLGVVSDVFAVPISMINANSSPETIETWDSMTHLNLVLALEEKFNFHLTPEEMESMRSLGQIAALCEAKIHSE
jgi:acyl carrier protein